MQSLQRKYYMMIQITNEKQHSGSGVQFIVKVELLHIAWFKTAHTNQKTAEETVYKNCIDYLVKLSQWKAKTNSNDNKIAPTCDSVNDKSSYCGDKKKYMFEQTTTKTDESDQINTKVEVAQNILNDTLPVAEKVKVDETICQNNLPAQLNNVDKITVVHSIPLNKVCLLINRFVNGKL